MLRYFGLDPSKNWTKEEFIQYDNTFIAEQDARGRVTAAEKKGMEIREIQAVLGMDEIGMPTDKIAQAMNISEEKVQLIIQAHKK